ncbi:uncharacterized protein LOC103951599 isoform X2 [Pyrus x bretschneideri]|uniref:uncharacterized protein LOC103951599 isoform X2 n=1 Tax=Pyrus x bretschneideri TaxID=225117 RepID=UPI00202E43EE|nr:uncharacterized protein LOC103951599 isoform X2 [Pyrus x bretschneideri]
MEAAAAARGSSMPMPPPPARKEWRAVSDHHSARNIGDEELERSKLGQSDERTIYEVQQGREPVDVDFCSITIDGTLDHDLLQQRVEDVSRQREELQHMEIDLKAQIIARSEIIEIQKNFDAQIKEHVNAASKLQEQLHEREQTIHDLERKMDEKDRELHAVRLDNEAAWAKEDLLREQNKELASIRERDHSEAERTQHIQQLHDLQEHIQENERQLNDLREQHRLAQEAILYKDERLREAQAWIAHVQEMDALQSTTIQAELRERTEQYNQLWLGCQRQFAEMERRHMHTVQQLQLELADARERSGTYTDESCMAQSNSKDASQFGQNNGNQLDMNTSNGNTGPFQNGNSDDVPSFPSTGNTSAQIDHVAGVPISPSSLLGMPSYLPPGQVTALHPFLMHQQGVPHSVPPHVPQSHVGHFHSIPAVSSLQQWQNQQAPSERLQISTQNELPSSQNDPNLIRPDYNYESSVNGQSLHQDYLNVQLNQGAPPDSVLSSSTGEAQVLESIDSRGYLVSSQPDQSLQQISSQFHNALRLDSLEQNSETKAPEQNVQTSTDHGLDGQVLTAGQPSSNNNSLKSDNSVPSVDNKEPAINNATSAVLPEAFVSTVHANAAGGKTSEVALLDERSLLVCMVRTIPAGGRIRISSTLPNRLGKMLAPLHWHDYKKKYGKLDDFVASHRELFVIEGDYIQLREGAQEMIAATAAAAKVAAAAAASSPYSSSLPSVAVTPVAQTHRSRKISTSNANDNHLQSVKQNQQLNGVSFGVPGGLSNVKILSKSKDSWELNSPDTRPSQSSVLLNGGNGAVLDRSSMSSTQSSGLPNGRLSSNAVGKQHGRMTNATFTSRR